MNKLKRTISLILVVILSLSLLVGCGDATVNEEDKNSAGVEKKIDIAYPNWVEGIAMTHLAKVILEEKMGKIEKGMTDCGSDYDKIQQLQKEIKGLKKKFNEKMNRWEYLSEFIETE